MKTKTISLRGLQEILNERELKSVIGGTGSIPTNGNRYCYACGSDWSSVIVCYGTFDSCLDQFNCTCEAGGYFNECSL